MSARSPRLPSTLTLESTEDVGARFNGGVKHKKRKMTRKQERKENRASKKMKKHEYHQRRSGGKLIAPKAVEAVAKPPVKAKAVKKVVVEETILPKDGLDEEIERLESKLNVQGGAEKLEQELKEDGLWGIHTLLDNLGQESGVDDSEQDSDEDLSEEELAKRQAEYESKAEVRRAKQKDLYCSTEDPKEATPATKYVPPHLRKGSEDESLRKRILGLINRVSVETLPRIGSELRTLFSMEADSKKIYARESMALSEAIVSVLKMPKSGVSGDLILCLAGLIKSLHSDSVYFPSAALEAVCDLLLSAEEVEYLATNSILLFSYLFSLGVVGHALVLDLLVLYKSQVNILLACLSACGGSLRRIAPAELKHFLESIEGDGSERMDFMIGELKSNRVAEDRIKPVKSWCGAGRGQALQVSWEDLVQRKDRGKWWLVGSSWKGRDDPSSKVESSNPVVLEVSSDYDHLHKQQRMNTALRKAIFNALVSAEDYVDAFQGLMRLNITKNEDKREIVRVLLHCCAQEKRFNTYYALLAAKLCNYERNHKLTLQLELWDLCKKLEEQEIVSEVTISNLAKLYVYLFTTGTLSLSVLKRLQLETMETTGEVLFFHVLLKEMCSHDHAKEMFGKLAFKKELQALRDGISLFLRRHIVPYYSNDHDVLKAVSGALEAMNKVLDTDYL